MRIVVEDTEDSQLYFYTIFWGLMKSEMSFGSRIIFHLYIPSHELCLILWVSMFSPSLFAQPQHCPLKSTHKCVKNVATAIKNWNLKWRTEDGISQQQLSTTFKRFCRIPESELGGAVHQISELCRCWQTLHCHVLLPLQNTKFGTEAGLREIFVS